MPAKMESLVVAGNSISYDQYGDVTQPAVVLLTGWCQDHRLFDPLVPLIAADHHVVRIDWRGHGEDRSPVADFGPVEQASDALAVVDSLGIDRFLPVSTSHGGWANMELTEKMTPERVPASIVIDWLMTPASPEFLENLAASHQPDWAEAQRELFDVWLDGSDNELVRNHLDNEMAAFDQEMWARSCDVIAKAYGTWGSPLQRMEKIPGEQKIRHLFSQPTTAGYIGAQEEFHRAHPWFSYKLLGGETHFPTLDSPQHVADEIRAMIRSL